MKKQLFLAVSCALWAGCSTSPRGVTSGVDTNKGDASDQTLRTVLANNNPPVAIAATDGKPIGTVSNPCDGLLTTAVVDRVTADTLIIPPSGKRRYYCTILLANAGMSSGMEKVSIVESTGGSVCASSPMAIVGGKNDADGWPLPGSGGKLEMTGLIAGPLMDAATCLKVSTGGIPINYVITYVEQ